MPRAELWAVINVLEEWPEGDVVIYVDPASRIARQANRAASLCGRNGDRWASYWHNVDVRAGSVQLRKVKGARHRR